MVQHCIFVVTYIWSGSCLSTMFFQKLVPFVLLVGSCRWLACMSSDEIYDERMPERYMRSTFSKYNGETNPWDHVALFEIEYGSISNNANIKAQKFSSTFIGQTMRWFNNRLPNSISSWDDFIEQFTVGQKLICKNTINYNNGFPS